MKRLGKLVPILVIVAMLVSMIGMVGTAGASQITGIKITVPISPNIYYVGDEIHYQVTVENPAGNTATNTLTRIWDTLPNGTVVELITEDLVQAPGVSNSWDVYYTVDAADIITLTSGRLGVRNQAEAEGYDTADDDVYALIQRNSVVIQPDICIEKTVDFDDDGVFTDLETGPYDGTATWKIVVTNCGDSPLTDVLVSDTNGGAWGPFDMDAGESQEITYDEPNIVADKCNTASAQGVDELGGTVGPVTDDACVEIEIAPCIEIEKTVDFDGDGIFGDLETAYVGDDATWKIVVTNCGDSPLSDVMVDDTNGGSWGPFDLDIGESWDITYDEANILEGKCNTATAEGLDVLGGPVGPVSDDACVEVINPDICIEKTVDFDGDTIFTDLETGPYDGTATWKIRVWNCGDSDLFDVYVTDTNGMDWGPFDLAPGEEWIQTYPEANITADKCNTATAEGVDELGNPVGPVEDDACVEVEQEFQGCTPGFWKNNASKHGAVAWTPTDYSPDDLFSDVFGVVITVRSGGKSTINDPTLLEALQANGGGVNALARHAVAALLNAAHPDINYAMSESEVIDAVHDALTSGDDVDVLMLAEDLDWYNNAGCPINQQGMVEEDGDDMVYAIFLPLLGLGGLSLRRKKVSA